MRIIAERINSSRKSIFQAIKERKADLIAAETVAQVDSGADYIDVNAGAFVGKEAAHLKWVIDVVQQVTDVPLCIDSPEPKVIEEVFPLVQQTPIINSISLAPARLDRMLALVAQHQTKVIALCQSEDKMAETAEDKIHMAGQLVKAVTAAGIALDDLYIDPLVFPVSTHAASASATLEAIEIIMKKYPGVHTICGLSNVSYGLPARKLINSSFLVAAITRGLDAVILDPTDKQLIGALRASMMIMGRDDFCQNFIAAFREGRLPGADDE